MRYTELREEYDATLDEYTVADIDETRRPRLTLKHLNRLRKMRELKKVEMEQRENFYNLIERGQSAIDGILEVAQQSDHPRAFEVAGNLIAQVAEVTEKLGKLQSAMKRLKEVPNNAPKNVTNALYIGSTAELQKMLKKEKKK